MNKSYVQRYVQLERNHWWFLVRKKILLSLLHKNLPGKQLKILNIGAAGGATSEWLTVFGDVQSVENDPYFLDHLNSLDIKVTKADITQLPFEDDSFDLVCGFDVLEHVEAHDSALKELHRVCKVDGHICITVPAFQQLWSHHDEVNGHFRRYRMGELNSLIQKCIAVQLKAWTYFNTILFIPILLTRKFQRKPTARIEKQQSDFETYQKGSIINKILYNLFSLELGLLKYWRLPFGVSLFCFLQKKQSIKTTL